MGPPAAEAAVLDVGPTDRLRTTRSTAGLTRIARCRWRVRRRHGGHVADVSARVADAACECGSALWIVWGSRRWRVRDTSARRAAAAAAATTVTVGGACSQPPSPGVRVRLGLWRPPAETGSLAAWRAAFQGARVRDDSERRRCERRPAEGATVKCAKSSLQTFARRVLQYRCTCTLQFQLELRRQW